MATQQPNTQTLNQQYQSGQELSGSEMQQSQSQTSDLGADLRSLALPTRLPRATLEEKIQILNYYHRSGKLQSDTVEEFKNQYAISTSSFSEWLKHETDLRERYNQSVSLTELSGNHIRQSKRKVRFKYEKINQAMDALVERRLLDGLPINEPILRDHWAIYARQFGVDDPKRLYSFSHGWLSQFKKRHGLDKKAMVELNRRTNPASPLMAKPVEDGVNTDERFYEVSQLLNSPQLLATNNGNTSRNLSEDVEGSTRFNDTNGQQQQQRRWQQSQRQPQPQGLSFNPLSQVLGNFPNQSFNSMAAPYIRLDNQVNRNGTSNTQLQTSLSAQQQHQLNMLNSNQALQAQVALNNQHHIRSGPNNSNNNNNNNNNNNEISNNGSNGNGRNDNTNNNNSRGNIHNNNNFERSLLVGNGRNMDLSGNDTNEIDNGIISRPTSLQLMEDSSADVVSDGELFSISMEDIEKFMYQWCDKFFHDHQQQFPKTSKIFRTFKDSFMREKFKAMMGASNSSRYSTEA